MKRKQKRLRLSCAAKLNLELRIEGRQPDGYHELTLLNTGITLYDELELALIQSGIEISCDHPAVPTGEDNLCFQAARAFGERLALRKGGVQIQLRKRIPVMAGLGGGSSNAAAMLWGLNRLWGEPLSAEELRELGATIGADVPFFLFQSPAWARGRGEILIPAPSLPDWCFLVVSFPFGVSTAWAFQAWDLTKPQGWDSVRISRGEEELPKAGAWRNDLEAVVAERWPQILRAKEELLAAGAVGAMMTGSGPSVFGVFERGSCPSLEKRRWGGGEEVMCLKALPVRGALVREVK